MRNKPLFPHQRPPLASNQRFSIAKKPSSLFEFLLHPFVIGLWILFCILSGISLIRSGLLSQRVLEQKKAAQEELEKEEEKGIQLIEELQKANSSTEKERIIREELRMQKPGEVILQLPTTSPSPAIAE